MAHTSVLRVNPFSLHFSCSSRFRGSRSRGLRGRSILYFPIPCKILNKLISPCYPHQVFAKLHSRRSLDSFSRPTPTPRPPLVLSAAEGSPSSHGINLFADPHPLNRVASYRYKIIAGEATFSLRPLDFQLSTVNLFPPNSFPLNTFADPHPLNPVTSILYKNSGGRGPHVLASLRSSQCLGASVAFPLSPVTSHRPRVQSFAFFNSQLTIEGPKVFPIEDPGRGC